MMSVLRGITARRFGVQARSPEAPSAFCLGMESRQDGGLLAVGLMRCMPLLPVHAYGVEPSDVRKRFAYPGG